MLIDMQHSYIVFIIRPRIVLSFEYEISKISSMKIPEGNLACSFATNTYRFPCQWHSRNVFNNFYESV